MSAPAPEVELEAGFRNPPASAKPRVWWHWVSGNVAEEGVRLDFEWMKRVGIGGVQCVEAAFEFGGDTDTSLQVKKPVTYLSPQWRQTLRYSVDLARELGLDFGIDSSPGWSQSGGPWVKPSQAMKKLVWSETWIQGGTRFRGRIAKPPETTGYFHNIPVAELGARVHEGAQNPIHYADVATIAYRAPLSELPFEGLAPAVTSSGGAIDAIRLLDGDLATAVSLPFVEGGRAWIQFSFRQPQRIRAITAVLGRPLSWDPLLEPTAGGSLEASEDGRTFSKVVDFCKSGFLQSSALQQTVSFQPTVAPVFRVVLERPELTPAEQLGLALPPTAHQVAQLVLHTGARVNRFEDKGGFSTRQILDEDATAAVAAADVILESDIVDLTGRMRPDGTLDWSPPAGRWVVLRFGCSLTGRRNIGSSAGGKGLEVDKLSRAHVKAYMDAYLGEYERALGKGLSGGSALQHVLTDSYEAGPQNWTDDILQQFKERRGYDALLWLAALAGRVVSSERASDGFLWDFRKTLGELISEAHYGQISASLRERGLRRYGESHEHGRAFVGDGMEVKKSADVPMGAIWAAGPPQLIGDVCDIDIRESASVAHIYGKKIVAGESFTTLAFFGNSSYAFAPETLKPLADRAMSMGLNYFAIANSVHQPDNYPGPGMSLGPIGQWFTRKETWAEQARCWVDYLTRSAYLLQQGQFVADIAYLYGEDANVTSLFGNNRLPQVPDGYNFDFVNADALLDELSMRGDRLVTRGGMDYRLLALDISTRRMSVPVLRKIRDLVRAGAVVVGAQPIGTPSHHDDDREFRAIVAELWGESAGPSTIGAGRVLANQSLAQAMATIDILPDVLFTSPRETRLRFVHRTLGGGDLYFVSNATADSRVVEASFRVSGKAPELWRADTGAISPLTHRMEGGRTIAQLNLEPHDAVFVVFRRPATAPSLVIPECITEVLATVEGPWEVSFPPGLGAPSHTRMETLHCWTDDADEGVRHFSGTATYRKSLCVPQECLKGGSRVHLELGVVKNLAEIYINGQFIGTSWKAPFNLDITSGVQAGDNAIEIRVTNLWPNRLIGDKKPGFAKIARASFDPFRADSPLLPSGLLGPVTLLRVSARV